MNLVRRLPSLLVVAFVAGACGGKVAGLDDPVGPDGGRTGPAPTCDSICARIIGACVPGATTGACIADCEGGTKPFATMCPAELDGYLRCMGTTRVECHGTEVVVIDCGDERNRLDACRR
jgi:hypothetical protein